MGFVISSSNPNELNYHISTSIVMMLTTPFIHFCAMYFILMYYKRFSKWVDNEIDFKELILLICPSLIGITSYSLFVDIDGHFSESLVFQGSKSIYIWMIHNFIILSCILLFLFLYQRILNHRDVKRKEFILKSQLINIEEHVAHIKDKYDQLRILKHDITSHISTISSLVNINNYSEANQIINELQNTLNDQKYNYNTGNPITDVILFEQSERFENANIKFTNKFHYPANADFKAIDLCVILYNTLQNAYEATINFSNTWVELSSIYYKGTYIITVKNPIHAEIKFKRDGLIESSKANKTEHGIGLYSVREISNKYSGDVNIDIEDGIFTINIILKNENTTSSSSLQ
ncbi:MAG: sensor histidine kinase [Candidatus Pristimantibacillus sp.]